MQNKIDKSSIFFRQSADLITYSRALSGLFVIIFLSNRNYLCAWLLIIIGGLSDILDGWLARKAGGGTTFGARLDPLADKILISAPLIWIASSQVLPLWAIWLSISREILISGWRKKLQGGAPASYLGKLKTILQFISMSLLLFPFTLNQSILDHIFNIGIMSFWASLILSLFSCFDYLFNIKGNHH